MANKENKNNEIASILKKLNPELKQHQLLKGVQSPIQKNNGFGDDPADLFEWDAVDAELMKRGTLSNPSTDWEIVACGALKLLEEKSKYPEVLEAAILGSIASKSVVDYINALFATYIFVKSYPSTTHPTPNRRYHLFLKRIFQILLNCEVDNVPESDKNWKDAAELVMIMNKDQSSCFEPHLSDVALLHKRVQKFLSANGQESEKVEANNTTIKTGAVEQKGKVSSPPVPSIISLSVDRDERTIKKEMATMADTFFAIDASLPLGYELRRFATWYGVTVAPPLRDEKKTVIAPPGRDFADHCSRLIADAKMPDLAFLLRLERMTFNAPFWLEGQFLAFQLAILSDHFDVSATLQKSTAFFVRSNTWIDELEFSDGSPFLPESVNEWLESAPSVDRGESLLSQSSNNYDPSFSDIVSKTDVHEIEQSLFEAEETRVRVLGELSVFEALSQQGLKQFAALGAKRLSDEIIPLSVKDWEPSMISRLEKLSR